MLIEKIKKLIKLGEEAASLSENRTSFEPSLNIIWKNDEIISEFYSDCLELGEEGKHHRFVAKNELEIEEWLDHLIMLATREITVLSRREEIGCG